MNNTTNPPSASYPPATPSTDNAVSNIANAIVSFDLEFLRKFLQKGNNISLPDKMGMTPLHVATISGVIRVVDLIISCGGELDAKNRTGQTAMMLAAKSGDLATVKLLLKHKANVNLQDSSGMTAIMYAISAGHIDIVKILTEYRANLELKDNNGRSALLYALHSLESVDIDQLQILKDALTNAKIEQNNEAIKNSELKIRREMRKLENQQKNLLITKELTNAGADINAQDNELKNAMMYAIEKQQAVVVTDLIEKGANLTLKDNLGRTAFHLANEIQIKNQNLIMTLNNAQITIDEELRKCLNIVPIVSNIPIVPNTPTVPNTTEEININTDTPLPPSTPTTVSTSGNIDINLNISPIVPEISIQSLPNEQDAQQIDPNSKNESGQTPLMLAAYKGDLVLLNALLLHGGDVGLKDSKGFTALMFASIKGNLEVVKILLKNRSHIDGKNNEGMTSSALATIANQASVLKYLVEKGAKTNLTFDGKSLLMLASIYGAIDSAKVLIKLGMNPFIKDFSGKTAFEYAILYKQKNVIQYYKQIKK
ncbi:MAG: ankyrin repeat domain-containing protein [Oligoflexia bacterium]|nr:ankyrin repeat domain-containing protein [Oligoflexia bacterium]